ncbi:hypothetical protein BDB00DRAFT_867944 [Zychaea mexicana]|uniref:uncharacterized protein n=1 Tax=Zychaea mexicana TaxID=64656 RepID=UPI0022FE11DF|nr:uncharacterized protein BDB00DRAFT_867944 [Zychaea mexicana]KAI9497817.1 hypothetical protein BDB00DRAFT_867944 [Zychaea mexicana]
MAIVNHNYSLRTEPEGGFKTLDSFYPYYLGEHCHKTNRRLHIIGTTNSVLITILAIVRKRPQLLLLSLVQGYALAWLGHFVFEKNKPATFRYPIYSLICDFKMWSEVVTGKRKF